MQQRRKRDSEIEETVSPEMESPIPKRKKDKRRQAQAFNFEDFYIADKNERQETTIEASPQVSQEDIENDNYGFKEVIIEEIESPMPSALKRNKRRQAQKFNREDFDFTDLVNDSIELLSPKIAQSPSAKTRSMPPSPSSPLSDEEPIDDRISLPYLSKETVEVLLSLDTQHILYRPERRDPKKIHSTLLEFMNLLNFNIGKGGVCYGANFNIIEAFNTGTYKTTIHRFWDIASKFDLGIFIFNLAGIQTKTFDSACTIALLKKDPSLEKDSIEYLQRIDEIKYAFRLTTEEQDALDLLIFLTKTAAYFKGRVLTDLYEPNGYFGQDAISTAKYIGNDELKAREGFVNPDSFSGIYEIEEEDMYLYMSSFIHYGLSLPEGRSCSLHFDIGHSISLNISRDLCVYFDINHVFDKENPEGVVFDLAKLNRMTLPGVIKQITDLFIQSWRSLPKSNPSSPNCGLSTKVFCTKRDEKVVTDIIKKWRNSDAMKKIHPAYRESISRNRADLIDSAGDNLLHLIAKTNDFKNMERFAIKPKMLDRRNASGKTPLYIAIAHNSFEIVNWLLKKGANPHVKSFYVNPFDETHSEVEEFTNLHLAANTGNAECARILLDYRDKDGRGIDLNIKNNFGETAIQFAIGQKRFNVVKLLLTHVTLPDLTIKNGAGLTPIDYAFHEHFDMFVYMFKLALDSATESKHIIPLLKLFINYGQNHLEKLSTITPSLLQYELDATHNDAPLIMVAANLMFDDETTANFFKEIFKLNLDHENTVSHYETRIQKNMIHMNGNEYQNKKPLHYAIDQKNMNAVRALIKLGANTHVTYKNNQSKSLSLIEYAKQISGCADIVKLLQHLQHREAPKKAREINPSATHLKNLGAFASDQLSAHATKSKITNHVSINSKRTNPENKIQDGPIKKHKKG